MKITNKDDQNAFYKDPAYLAYLEERKILIDGERAQQDALDKALLTVASGAFALSLGIVPQFKNVESKYCLVTSWVLLGLSIITTMLSFMTSVKSYENQMKINDARYEKSQKSEKGNRKTEPKNQYLKCIEFLNWVSLYGVIIGIIFLGIFVMRNI